MLKNTIPWKYNGATIESLDDMPPNMYGFIYETLYTETNHKYIGKKALFYNRKKKLTKKQLQQYEGRKGRKPTHEYVRYESDWKTYYGSHPIIKELQNTHQHMLERNILQFAINKKHLTYLENKWLFSMSVLENEEYLNLNIQGRFFREDFNSWFDENNM